MTHICPKILLNWYDWAKSCLRRHSVMCAACKAPPNDTANNSQNMHHYHAHVPYRPSHVAYNHPVCRHRTDGVCQICDTYTYLNKPEEKVLTFGDSTKNLIVLANLIKISYYRTTNEGNSGHCCLTQPKYPNICHGPTDSPGLIQFEHDE